MQRMKPVLIGLAVLVVVAAVGKNAIAKAAVSGGVKVITGLDTQIKSMRVGVITTTVGIKGLRVLNPRGFPDRVMVDVPDLFVDYKLGAFLRGKAHLEAVRLNLQELHVVKAADGTLNLHSVKALESGQVKEETRKQQQQPAKAMPFRIDVLELKIGRVIYKDYTKSPPLEQVFNVNIDERYEHITNPYSFAALVATRALAKTTVARLASFDLAGLQGDVTNALKVSAGQFSGELTKHLGGAQQVGEEAFGEAGKAVDEAAGALKKMFGNR